MKAGLAQKEPAIAAKWAADDLYGQIRTRRAGRERFLLHDGPPYANGDIHMGHAMNKVLKDIIIRGQTLLGKDAPYVPGWDCHGLPIEWKIEEEYRKQKKNKDEVPPAEFRAQCRAYADKWVGVQKEQFKRLGILGDWEDPYLTMKYDAEATIVGELLKFAESGQLYRGAKPVMWSPVEKTALAEAEVEYEDVTSTQIDVAFEITSAPNAPELVGAYAVIWTTTPWTIPTNQGIAYGEEIEYVLVDFSVGASSGDSPPLIPEDFMEYFRGKQFVIADQLLSAVSERISRHFSNIYNAELRITPFSKRSVKGTALKGTTAKHPMADRFPDSAFFTKPRPFLPAPHVTTDAGTGLVHMAPDHGEEDFFACKPLGIDPVFAVGADGMYRADWAWLGGQGSVINEKFNSIDGPILQDLQSVGALLAHDKLTHSYPKSWRSKARIIYRCTPQWFIPMDKADGYIPLPIASADPLGGAIETMVPNVAGTLRNTALAAIEDTRWVPERSINRIRSMVEGRPDWVISRQRAWGVPIALYVHRQSGEYLVDSAVNARIVEAFKAGGADAWFGADHQALLGSNYDLADYEVINDILDVWFDSGSTHAFVVEARYGKDAQADLYLEGSDQHRGWFQSSLLESCGTRGQAPYKAVLTHGFALDGQGRKMSKSLGNVVDPLKIMNESGADILRMWVASTDYFDDVKIGKEVLAGASDAYRKLRNTFRYLLGALSDFSEDERVAQDDMPELERYMLHRLAELDLELRGVMDKKMRGEAWLELGRYTRALNDFANSDLSAFFFDIRKDCLYCDAKSDLKRRAYRTVLDTLFHALVRYAAPIIPFTAEEVWQSRYPEAQSIHLEEWPHVHTEWRDERLGERWATLKAVRDVAFAAAERARAAKDIRSTLEAKVSVIILDQTVRKVVLDHFDVHSGLVSEIFLSNEVNILKDNPFDVRPVEWNQAKTIGAVVFPASDHKCGRCWRLLPEVAEDGALCGRCADVVGA